MLLNVKYEINGLCNFVSINGVLNGIKIHFHYFTHIMQSLHLFRIVSYGISQFFENDLSHSFSLVEDTQSRRIGEEEISDTVFWK